MIEDQIDQSKPIINTDMRFGFITKAQWGLSGPQHNEDDHHWTIGLRLTPWAHESTHLGDEFSISAEARLGDAFRRVNVSYEYWEYGLSVETDNLILRHGGLRPWNANGYYPGALLDAQGGRPVSTTVEKWVEPSFGVEYHFASDTKRNVFVSLDARWRAVYAYDESRSDTREWSFSFMVGRATPRNTRGLPLKAYYFHVYHGVNPHGQFRSRSSYTFFGLGFTFDR